MATTTTVRGVNLAKGPHADGSLHAYEFAVTVTGTYDHTAKPSFDVLASLQAQHEGVSAVAVKSATLFQDGTDGTNRYTAPNAAIALSNSGNKTVTFEIDSGATDGDSGGAQIADAVALNHTFSFLIVADVTGA